MTRDLSAHTWDWQAAPGLQLEPDVSDNDIPRPVESIADWLAASGGLRVE